MKYAAVKLSEQELDNIYAGNMFGTAFRFMKARFKDGTVKEGWKMTKDFIRDFCKSITH